MRRLLIPKEFLGAFKAGHRKASRDFIDEEFATKLLQNWLRDGCEESRAVLQYLTRFNNEYHKNVIRKGDPEALHSSDELRRDCYDRDYSRRQDVFTTCELIDFKDFRKKKTGI